MNIKFIKDVSANILTLVINVISPLILIPILANGLGMSLYGDYMALIGLVALCTVIADLGFDMYLSKEISIFRNDLTKISRLLSVYLVVKVLFSILLLLFLYLLLPKLAGVNQLLLLALVWFLYVNTSLKPTAFFNGLEKYVLLSQAEILGKLLLVLLVLILDFTTFGIEKALGVQLVSGLFINIVLFYLLNFKLKLKLCLISTLEIKQLISDSFGFFSARLFVNIYNQSSTYLVSLVLKSELVAAYSIGIQLYKVGQAFVGAIAKVLYTRTVKSKNFNLVLRLTIIILTLQFVCFPIVYYWGEDIIAFILNVSGNEVAQAANVFYISLFFVTVASFWGYPVMVALDKERYAHYGIFFGSIVYFITFGIGYLFFEFDLFFAVLCILIADMSSCILRIYFSKKFISKKMLFR